jgi:hypothetical protein
LISIEKLWLPAIIAVTIFRLGPDAIRDANRLVRKRDTRALRRSAAGLPEVATVRITPLEKGRERAPSIATVTEWMAWSSQAKPWHDDNVVGTKRHLL